MGNIGIIICLTQILSIWLAVKAKHNLVVARASAIVVNFAFIYMLVFASEIASADVGEYHLSIILSCVFVHWIFLVVWFTCELIGRMKKIRERLNEGN